jgi:hypothetical protein
VKIRILVIICVAVATSAWGVGFSQRTSTKKKGVIVRAAKPYDNVKNIIRSLGGDVTYEYENVDAIAAHVPEDKVASVIALMGPLGVYKDMSSLTPEPLVAPGGRTLSKGASVGVSARGSVALSGNDIAQIGSLSEHRDGNRGQNVIVAVMDSGVAEVSALRGSVIGGESFVAADPLSATSSQNPSHGTEVASLIAGHTTFILDNSSPIVQALRTNDPGSVIRCPNSRYPSCGSNQSVVPLIGTAPESKIYALKVFDSNFQTTESRIIAAMDRLITMRKNYERGRPSVPVNSPCGSETKPCVYNSLNVQVVNMSLGSSTLFAGRELAEELTKRLLDVGITPVVSAGNEGFAAMTGTSPGTGLGSLTVGAASVAARHRALVDYWALTDGDPTTVLGDGKYTRANNITQAAWFSPRGPTSDGRIDPELVSSGVGKLVQGSDGMLRLVEGTSYSSPDAAGGAAVLFGAVREGSATATEVRNALWESANPTVLGDNSSRIDQGRGYLDISAALRLLRSGDASSKLPENNPSESVVENIRNVGFAPVEFNNNVFSTRIRNLRPGEVAHFFVQTRDEVNRLVVRLRNITPELPADKQNQFFGDDTFVRVADATTHIITGNSQVYVVDEFVNSNSDFVIDEPQTGLVRVAVMGTYTNAGRISADLVIERRKRDLLPETAEGRISEGDVIPIQVRMPAGKTNAVFELFWESDWAAYPTNDLDMIVCPPAGAACYNQGASLDSPERTVIANPAPGTWTVHVIGFTLHTRKDMFKLRATADGERLSSTR